MFKNHSTLQCRNYSLRLSLAEICFFISYVFWAIIYGTLYLRTKIKGSKNVHRDSLSSNVSSDKKIFGDGKGQPLFSNTTLLANFLEISLTVLLENSSNRQFKNIRHDTDLTTGKLILDKALSRK